MRTGSVLDQKSNLRAKKWNGEARSITFLLSNAEALPVRGNKILICHHCRDEKPLLIDKDI